MSSVAGPGRPAGGDGPSNASRRRLLVSLVVVLILLVLLFWQAPIVPLLVFAAVLLAVIQRGLATFLAAHSRLSVKWSLLVILIVAFGLTLGVGWLLMPRLIDQIQQLSKTLPDLFKDWADYFRAHGWGRWLVGLVEKGAEIERSGKILAQLRGVFSSTVGAVTYIILTVITSIYVAAEADVYRRGLLLLLPRHHRQRASELLDALGRTLRYWMLAQSVSMVFLAVFAYIGLRILGIPLALMLALLTGLLTFIPNLGAIMSVIGAMVLALSKGVVRALIVFAFYVVLQNVEGYLLTPLVQRRVVSIPPALLLLTQVMMAVVFGFLGLLLAAPFTAVLLVTVKMLYLEDVLGEKMDVPR